MQAYKTLEDKFKDVFYFNKALSLLKWDSETYMPKGAFNLRSNTVILLEKYKNLILEDKANLELLKKAYDESSELNELELRNLDLMKEEIELASVVDFKLKAGIIELCSKLEHLWHKAMVDSETKTIIEDFKKLVLLIKEKSQVLADYYCLDPYTALVRQYDPLVTSAILQSNFKELESQEIKKNKLKSNANFAMPIDDQKKLIMFVIEVLGFDEMYMNLSVTAHPFCDGSHEDIRLAITYKESDWTNSLLGAVHELGHALYDRFLPEKLKGTLIGMDAGMTIHESQGLFFEFFLAKSREFSEYLYQVLGDMGYQYSVDDLYTKFNESKESLVRIDSDKDAYGKHILLRYQVEKKLINSELSVEDIEAFWSEFYLENFFIQPRTVNESWIQDIHWFLGYFGYFPCYYLGLKMAENLWSEYSAKIDSKELNRFLDQKIYSKARLFQYN